MSSIFVFFSSSSTCLCFRETINHLCNIIDNDGADYWWNLPIEKLLPENILMNDNIKLNDVKKSQVNFYCKDYNKFTAWQIYLGVSDAQK